MLARFRHMHITPGVVAKFFAVSLIVAAISGSIAVNIGYRLGAQAVSPETEAQLVSLQQVISREKDSLKAIQSRAEDDMDALAIRLGELQAKTMRLEAVGQRLAQVADVDVSEFSFDETPAMGDVTDGESGKTQTAADLISNMEMFEKVLNFQDQQLSLLEEMIMVRELRKDILPSGMPVKNG